jgi:hypothetical protein
VGNKDHATTKQNDTGKLSKCLLKIGIFMGVTIICIAEENKSSRPKTSAPLLPMTVEEYREFLPTKDTEIGATELLKLQKKGPVVLLDVRSRESYEQRHLKGAINIPLTDLTDEALLKNIPDRTIPVVLMCDYSFQPMRMIPMTLQAHPVLAAQRFAAIYRLNLWHSKGDIAVLDPAEQDKLLDFEGKEVKHK